MDGDAGFRRRSARHERQPPDLLRASDRHVDLAILLVERDAVRRGGVADELLQLAVGSQAPDAPGLIADAALSLVGEVEVAVVGEVQVVQPLEALAERRAKHLLYFSCLRVQGEEPAAIIADEGAAVAM